MPKNIRKLSRKGLTRAKWIEVIQAVFRVVCDGEPTIEFTPEGIMVNKYFQIGFSEWKAEWKGFGKNVEVWKRGYELITWETTPYSYHEPQDTYDKSHGNFESPYEVTACIVKMIFAERLNGVLEGIYMDEQAKEEAKYAKECEEMFFVQEKEGQESGIDRSDDYRDQVERHNRQVLSRL